MRNGTKKFSFSRSDRDNESKLYLFFFALSSEELLDSSLSLLIVAVLIAR